MGAAQNRALGTGKARNGLMPEQSKAATDRVRLEVDEWLVCDSYPRILYLNGARI
jgi:hypothetical protein